MVTDRGNLSNCLALLALATAAWGLTGQAGEPASPEKEPSSQLNFSSGSSLDALLPSSLEDSSRRLRIPESERSFQGLLRDSGGFDPGQPQPAPSARTSRTRNDWSERLSREGSWLDIELESGRPSAAAFRRAAGVRDYTMSTGEELSDTASGTSFSGPNNGDNTLKPDNLGLNPEADGPLSGDSMALPTSGRSLDPILPSRLGLPFGSNRGGASPLAGTVLEFDSAGPPSLNSISPQNDSLLDLQGSRLNPLTSSEWIDNRSPRSVRELIQTSEATSTQRTREFMILNQDSTRMDLNPYVPGRREDFQFSQETLSGDARLGIEARSGSPDELASPSPLRSLSSQSSSLAPAVALPVNNAPIPASRGFGQGNRYQFPARRF